MPLNSPISYAPTLQEFLVHWGSVNAQTGTQIVLPEGTIADAQILFTELQNVQLELRGAIRDIGFARWNAQDARTQVRLRLEQFGDLVRTFWRGSYLVNLVPLLPPVAVGLDKYLAPCRDALRLWALLDERPAPPGIILPLKVGPGLTFSRADYTSLVETTRLEALAQEAAEFAADEVRARRNALQDRVRALLTSYVRAIHAQLAKESTLVTNMPRLWPLPGHTPAPVKLTAVWAAERNAARLSWEASKDSKLSHYELRGCAGPEYVRDDETLIAQIPPTDPLTIETRAHLSQPGSIASYRVYVVLTSDNERGSKTATVEWPD